MPIERAFAGTVAQIAAFWNAFLASLHPVTDEDVRLVGEELETARGANSYYTCCVPVAAMLVALMNSQWVSGPPLFLWPAAVIAIYFAFELRYRALLRTADYSRQDVQRRSRAFAVMALFDTAAWCSLSLVFWVPGNQVNNAIIVILLCCTLSGWSSLGAVHLATAIVPLPVYLFVIGYGPVMHKNWVGIGIALSYWLLMGAMLLANYGTRSRAMRLKHERDALIHDLKSAKQDSDDARRRAEEASRAKSRFLANMSHELRTPLNAILGFSEIIHTTAMGPTAIDQYAEYGGYIHSSGRHLLELINDVLDLAKIEAGRMTLHETEVDLRRLMEENLLLLSVRAKDARVALSIRIAPDFPTLLADERALRQILANLASNAVKYTPPGGNVVLFAEVAEEGAPAFGVSDSGVGIALDEQEHVFESFGQGRHDTVLPDHGTGLGLPIVQGLVNAHGGRVTLESTPNIGTTVTVIMPLERARAQMREAS